MLTISEVPLSEVPPGTAEDQTIRPMVLVVDDEHIIAETLGEIFKHSGFAALVAYDGQTALELAVLVPPDVLLTDMHMPIKDGVTLAMEVADRLPECRVLLFSGHATPAHLEEARAAGYNFRLLSKPVGRGRILDEVQQCLAGQRCG